VRGLLAAAAVAVAIAAGACSSEPPSPVAGLDVLGGVPRVADAAGVLTAVDGDTLMLDDGLVLDLGPDVATFSTYTLTLLPLDGRVGQYVHVGLADDGRVVWVAVVGNVTRAADGTSTVLVTSDLLLVHDGRAYFRDGTVLATGPGVTVDGLPAYAFARIDVATDLVIEITVP